LVLNAIVVWNTRYFEQAQAELGKQGDPVPEEVWQHLSPILWEHIQLVGSYHFTDAKLEGEFRPLREYQGKHSRQEKNSHAQQISEPREDTPEEEVSTGTEEPLSLVQLALLPLREEVLQ
jgi:hypothetical protein